MKLSQIFPVGKEPPGTYPAKKTFYSGHHYDSRLEAKFAVFLDCLGLDYIPHPKDFRLSDGTHFQPDFFIPQTNSYVELKSHSISKVTLRDTIRRLELLSKDLGVRCHLISDVSDYMTRDNIFNLVWDSEGRQVDYFNHPDVIEAQKIAKHKRFEPVKTNIFNFPAPEQALTA
jgi:hypothetical protein